MTRYIQCVLVQKLIVSHVSTVSLSHFSSVAPVLPMTYLAYDLYSLFSFNRPTLPPTYNLHVTCLHCSIVLTPVSCSGVPWLQVGGPGA